MTIETHEQYLAAKNRFYVLDHTAGLSDDGYAEMHDLATSILDYERDVLGIVPEFRVRDSESLEWYIGKIADLESKKKRIQAQADAMIKDIDRNLAGLEFRFGDQAERVLRDQLTGKRKSLKTLHGTIGLRKTPGRVGFGGPLERLAEQLGDEFAHTVTKVDSAALNKAIKVVGGTAYFVDGGEEVQIEGLEIKPEGEKLYIKAGSEE